MSRCLPYRVECNEKCLRAQNDALNSTFFILRQTGPTAFVLKDNERTIKVLLGDPHQCSCSSFQRDQELCKHICWLLLKRFRVPRSNPILWQRGLVEREINELLRELARDGHERDAWSYRYKRQADNDNHTDKIVEQRPIDEHDVCPICQEELLGKELPMTYCRHGCGNNIHVACMKVWLDHQVSIGEKMIKCPLCRETFGTPEQLKLEFQAATAQRADNASLHLGCSCHRCHACPINGKCYKCTICQDYFLCQKCFNSNVHSEHNFDYREKSYQRWKIATREHLRALPNALRRILANREINENDYNLLIQLENAQNAAIMGIPENAVRAIPTERINESSPLVQNGELCCFCLRHYQIGERVRCLPCQHKFHIDCIDGWLLHSHATCPIDNQPVWNVNTSSERKEMQRPSTSTTRRSRRNISTPTTAADASFLTILGFSMTPHQNRPVTCTYPNHRFRRSGQREPYRPTTASASMESFSSLEVNAPSLRSHTNLMLSNDVEHRQFRRQSILSSPSLVTQNHRRFNGEFNQNSMSSVATNSLRQRSRSSAK